MKVTQVALRPTQASNDASRPALTPELLAATGARYSRSNDGLDAILAKIDPENPDKSIDSIFRFIDYGHQSVADMVPVALFMDGISMWLAYHIWSLCPTAGGQESSTRYIQLAPENLPDAEEIGIPESQRDSWRDAMSEALQNYESALNFWHGVAEKDPSVMRIPATLLNDDSDKARKTVARMKRNYAFDRARYFLPVALKTNVMMVQSARAWVNLCQQLFSHPLPEAQQLATHIRDELELVAPRMIKHAAQSDSLTRGLEIEWKQLINVAWMTMNNSPAPEFDVAAVRSNPRLEVWGAPDDGGAIFAEDLRQHETRYAFIGEELRRTPVRFGWGQVAFGDIRDLNRHRTGTKVCLLMPWGFYGATDQTDDANYHQLAARGAQLAGRCMEALRAGQTSFVYWMNLGAQFDFEHTTTADKFIYEAELRTGVGAHYRYANHLREVLQLWYDKFPATRGLILEGSAEPE